MKQAKLKAETIVARMLDAALSRKAALIESGKNIPVELTRKNSGIIANLDPEANSYREFLHAVNATKTFIDFSFFTSVLAKHHFSGANDALYVQCKTIEKVIKLIKAFGFKDARKLDPHSRLVLINTLVQNGVISSKNAFATLVRVEFDALDEQTVLRVRAPGNGYSPGTGNTQISSTREMLRILKLTEGVKGARDAEIVLLDESKAAMVQHFDEFAKYCGISDAPETEEPDDISEE